MAETVSAALSEFLVFALCLFLQPADATSARVDSLGPDGVASSYVFAKTGDAAWEIREEFGENNSLLLYKVEALDAERGAYRFAAGEGRSESREIDLSRDAFEFANHNLSETRDAWLEFEAGVEVHLKKSGVLRYLKPLNSPLLYVIHP